MDLRRLRYFARVVEAKSISRAAASLNVAQPALTKSIQALEQDLETPLLHRSAQGVIMTEAGERLYEHCLIVFQQLDRARLEVRKSVEKPSGHVAIGMPYSIIRVLALPLLEATTRAYPRVHLEITQDHSHLLTGRVRSSRIDFAIVAAPRSNSGLICSALLQEELFLIDRSEGAALRSRSPISLEDASKRPYVMPGVGNGLRALAEGQFRAHSLPFEVRHEVDAISIVPQCVQAGLGASILPGGCVGRDEAYARLAVRRFAEGAWHRSIVICLSDGHVLTPTAQAIMALTEKIARDMVKQDRWLGGQVT
jgi:DNA-binding transcriptional LysR family regulator